MTRTHFQLSLLGAELGGLAESNSYLTARIGRRFFGRSRRVPEGSGYFDLSKEASAWEVDEVVDGLVLPVVVELWEDERDKGSRRLTSISVEVAAPPIATELDLGKGLSVRVHVRALEVPEQPARVFVPRTPDGDKLHATLRIPNTVMVEISEIRGLRRPLAEPRGFVRAAYEEGYTSGDDLGRIYLNHDHDGAWARNHQAIELTASLTCVRGIVPNGTKLRWAWVDVDDPTDADPNFHAEWRSYVDVADYARNGAAKGARGKDNRAKPAVNPPWSEVPGYALSGASASRATTAVDGGRSKVLLHCPGRAGANLVVRVDVEQATGLESFPATTGTMTVWHRLDVANLRMQGAFELPLAEVAARFEPMCVQLDFAAEEIIPDQRYIATGPEDLTVRTAAFIETVFHNREQPGWFCVVAALEPFALPAGRDASATRVDPGVIEGLLGHEWSDGTLYEFVDVDGQFTDAAAVRIASNEEVIYFAVEQAVPYAVKGQWKTRLFLASHDLMPEFTAGDGSLKHAMEKRYEYGPRFTQKPGSSARRGGYRLESKVPLTIVREGEQSYPIGISPSLVKGKRSYFAGRTCMFTHHRKHRDPATGKPAATYTDYFVTVVVHELVHAFGMPHKCGYFDFRAPRQFSCCMNYSRSRMLGPDRELIPNSSDRCGKDVCGRHLEEVRAVRLQDNKGLSW